MRQFFWKKLPSVVDHKTLNTIKGSLWKSDKWLPSYTQKTIFSPFAPNLQIQSQSPCETKFKKKKFQVLIIKFWIKWVVCENLTIGCQVMPKKPFWVHLPQIYKLGPSPHVRLNFRKNVLVDNYKILNKMRGCLWKSDNWLRSYAQKNHFGPIRPKSLY